MLEKALKPCKYHIMHRQYPTHNTNIRTAHVFAHIEPIPLFNQLVFTYSPLAHSCWGEQPGQSAPTEDTPGTAWVLKGMPGYKKQSSANRTPVKATVKPFPDPEVVKQ